MTLKEAIDIVDACIDIIETEEYTELVEGEAEAMRVLIDYAEGRMDV